MNIEIAMTIKTWLLLLSIIKSENLEEFTLLTKWLRFVHIENISSDTRKTNMRTNMRWRGKPNKLDTKNQGLQRWENSTETKRNTTFLVKELKINEFGHLTPSFNTFYKKIYLCFSVYVYIWFYAYTEY